MMDDKLYSIARRVAGYSHNVRVGGKIEFVKDQGPVRRDIRVQGFEWSPDALRNLAKIHWAVQRAHSYGMAALRLFSKMPSSQFSPDGLLGGRGYIQSVKDMRNGLGQAVEVMSSFTDTVFDEINADHWQQTESSEPEVQQLVQDAEQVKANPEQFVEDQYGGEGDFMDPTEATSPEDGSEEDPIENPSADDYNPEYESGDEDGDEDEDDGISQFQTASVPARRPELMGGSDGKEPTPNKRPASQLPSDPSDQGQGKSEAEILGNTTTPSHGNYASAIRRVLVEQELRARLASSSVDQSSLPGPRVEHVGPGMNGDPEWASDDPSGDGLASGVNDSDYLLDPSLADGVTGYGDPTDGDSSVLKTASRVARECYSWLPGANNDRNLNYYDRGLTEADVEWMRQHASPEMPPGILAPEKPAYDVKSLWEVDL